MDTGLFRTDVGLFCGDVVLFGRDLWLFCGDLGLFSNGHCRWRSPTYTSDASISSMHACTMCMCNLTEFSRSYGNRSGDLLILLLLWIRKMVVNIVSLCSFTRICGSHVVLFVLFLFIGSLILRFTYRVAKPHRMPSDGLKSQVSFRKSAINYRAFLRKLNCKNKASYGSWSPCSFIDAALSRCVFTRCLCICMYMFIYKRVINVYACLCVHVYMWYICAIFMDACVTHELMSIRAMSMCAMTFVCVYVMYMCDFMNAFITSMRANTMHMSVPAISACAITYMCNHHRCFYNVDAWHTRSMCLCDAHNIYVYMCNVHVCNDLRV